MIKIVDFARDRGVQNDTVMQYIRRQREKNDNAFPDCDFGRDGRDTTVNSESKSYKILCDKYPLPMPVQVIEDKESRQQLLAAQEKLIAALEKIEVLTMENAAYKSLEFRQNLLEEDNQKKEQQLVELQKKYDKREEDWRQSTIDNGKILSNDLDKIMNTHQSQIKELQVQHEAELEELKEQLRREKSKSWWDKLCGR